MDENPYKAPKAIDNVRRDSDDSNRLARFGRGMLVWLLASFIFGVGGHVCLPNVEKVLGSYASLITGIVVWTISIGLGVIEFNRK
jgi:hypothetical protein